MISVGSVTHRMLFLETPIRLPVLNVDLPLNGFFFVAPIIYVIFHFYLLLQLSLLAQRARDYNEAVSGFGFSSEDENRLRQRLDSAVILQFIAGPQQENHRRLSAMLALIAWVTMAVVPVLLLVFMQLQYLPYHHPWITWLHRICVIVDLVILWAYWGGISGGKPIVPGWTLFGRYLTVTGTVLVFLFVFVAAYPGEAHYYLVRSAAFLPTIDSRLDGTGNPVLTLDHPFTSPTELMFEGDVDDVEGDTAGWFANRLIVPDQDFVDDKVLVSIREREKKNGIEPKPGEFETINSFRGRDLRGAILDRTDLRRSDFTAAILSEASVEGARLDHSRFECADTRRPPGEDFRSNEQIKNDKVCADLTGTKLDHASLQGAAFAEARLQGANFENASLQGAVLNSASLQGASFAFARLHGASLLRASLQGATLDGASLEGSTFNFAKLHGATLNNSSLRGALLDGAQLQGASLISAGLDGASLNSAKLQGAAINGVTFRGAALSSAFVWRAYGRLNSDGLVGIWIDEPQLLPISNEEFEKLKEIALQGVEGENTKRKISDALNRLKASRIQVDRMSLEEFWNERDMKSDEEESVLEELHRRRLAELLVALACSDDGENAPHVAQGLVRYYRLEALGSPHLAGVAKRFLDAAEGKNEDCRGVMGLNAESIALLRKWAGE
ncbi:pentapeptide repeat-containing protein [Nitratireductor sp. XY-223]|uniref:pentapeptide repeat-containing protein n=1 Tax=Nitratireductor sp. XY-223 TaxID=2561926 RepID=UPI00145B4C16|nr:pentapeptide repeat-containing protein [Nitratireductor sp. XY-223]